MTSLTAPPPSIKLLTVESHYFSITDPSALSEVPDHPQRILVPQAYWPTGSLPPVLIPIKPDPDPQIHAGTRGHACLHLCSCCQSATSAFMTVPLPPPPPPPSISFALFIIPFFFLLLQGIFGGGALSASSRRRGECERHHLRRQGGDACPGAAVGEGADGRPRPRLGAR